MNSDDLPNRDQPVHRGASSTTPWAWWGPLLLTVWIVVRWLGILFATQPLEDERVYFEAFAAMGEGRSPYGAGYLYPPIFAYVGAKLVGLMGEDAVLVAMRSMNVVGLAMLLWLAFLPIRDSRLRFGLSALIVALSPAVEIALRWGNLTPLISALLVASVLILERRWLPAIRRAAIGAITTVVGVLIKPLGAVVPLLLLWPVRRPDDSIRRVAQVAAFAALAGVAVGLLTVSGLEDFLALGSSAERSAGAGRSVSLLRLLFCFGIELPPLVMVVGVTLVFAGAGHYLTRDRGFDRSELISWLTVAALLATPIVWNHTTMMALPVQAGALAVWLVRRRRAPRWEGALVILAVLSQHLAAGVGGVEDQALWLQGLALIVPSLAPVFLLVYQVFGAPWRGLPWADRPAGD